MSFVVPKVKRLSVLLFAWLAISVAEPSVLRSSAQAQSQLSVHELAPLSYESMTYHPRVVKRRSWMGIDLICYKNGRTMLWRQRIFTIHFDMAKETDVQEVYLTNLEVKDAAIVVTDQRGKVFKFDPQNGRRL